MTGHVFLWQLCLHQMRMWRQAGQRVAACRIMILATNARHVCKYQIRGRTGRGGVTREGEWLRANGLSGAAAGAEGAGLRWLRGLDESDSFSRSRLGDDSPASLISSGSPRNWEAPFRKGRHSRSAPFSHFNNSLQTASTRPWIYILRRKAVLQLITNDFIDFQ